MQPFQLTMLYILDVHGLLQSTLHCKGLLSPVLL